MRGRALLVAVVALGIAADKKDDAVKAEQKSIEGSWALESGVVNGNKVPDNQVKDYRMIRKGDQATFQRGKETIHGTHTIDPTAKPKTVDITPKDGPNKDKTLLGIYELKGDTLKMCYGMAGKDRPTEFSSKANSGVILHIWKRVKVK
jgi:uncharacterized protein (TIGR03067 family)